VKQIEDVVYIATTNYPEKLQDRITNRPSRFDRRYKVELPNEEIRDAYIRHKLTDEDIEKIDNALSGKENPIENPELLEKRKIKLSNFDLHEYYVKEFLIALLFNLLIDIHIRVGNEIYAETNGSYGLTTLRQKHLSFNDNIYTLSFVGKSNIKHTIVIPNKYNEYFHFYKKNNGNGPLFFYGNKKKVIHSEELNDYLKENMGKDYTCKDFRTYSANILFIKAFLKNARGKEKSKKIILESIDSTAEHLGHSRNISRKSYISTNLLDYCYDSFDTAKESSLDKLVSKVWD
jgi:DNA topoisomerase IB